MRAAGGDDEVPAFVLTHCLAVFGDFDDVALAQTAGAIDVLDFVLAKQEMHAFVDLLGDLAAALNDLLPLE